MPLTLKFFVTYLILFTLPGSTFAGSPEKTAGHIIVTIKPLYSLVAHLTAGIEKPLLLMKQMQSAHHYNMRPSERRLLARAKMIIWVGPQMESYLSKVIQQQSATVVSAMQANELTLLQRRTKNAPSHAHRHTRADNLDPHIWLSTQNAIAISKHISQQLSEHDPDNRQHYQANLQHLISKIKQLSTEITATLKNNQQAFITYHDAFQYFEVENQLHYIDAINFADQAGDSLKHLTLIEKTIEKNHVQCLLYQAPEPGVVKRLAAQTRITAIALDPLGQNINDDENAWFEIMQKTAVDFKRCLDASSTQPTRESGS